MQTAFNVTLTLTADELAVLLAALTCAERAAEFTSARANSLRTGKDNGDGDALSVTFTRDAVRGMRQQITGKLCDTRRADHLTAEASRIQGADLRSAVQHVLKHSRLNADQTIRDEVARSPLEWDAVFTGSAESLLSRDASPALLRWFAARGIRP